MECTQKLECTQELYASETEEPRCPEQIGFLGICGTKYPVKRGPNKIGRDAQMCSIVLKLDSISRTHAVINIINGKDYMLMDLDSANKTRLNNKVLQAYIPYPLNNGDTVQFGEVFGLFRLLEDENDLPMTQAIDIPETPMANKHAWRVNKCGATTVPESPDVSDRDDSFIMPSQPIAKQSFKSPSNKFMKQLGKTTVIQPIGSHQIDNVFWNSSKKSLSFNESDINDDSMVTANNTTQQTDDIHEMETQPPFPDKMADDRDSIYTANTQIPNVSGESIYSANTQDPNDSRDSIYSAATQIPNFDSIPPINSLDTQMPEHLPTVQRISDQKDMHFDIFSANKENISIHNAETQIFTGKKSPNVVKAEVVNEEDIFDAAIQYPVEISDSPDLPENIDNIYEVDNQNAAEKTETVKDTNKKTSLKAKPSENNQSKQSTSAKPNTVLLSNTKDKLNTTSDEEILFDELDGQSFEDDFDSQPLIPSEGFEFKDGEPDIPLSQTKLKVVGKSAPDDSKECDDIVMLPTQKLATLPANKQDLVEQGGTKTVTSKESDDITMLPTQKLATLPANKQDLVEQGAINTVILKQSDDIAMLPTHKLSTPTTNEEDLTDCEDNSLENERNKVVSISKNKYDSPNMLDDDVATQVLEEIIKKPDRLDDITKNVNSEVPFDEMATQVLEEDEILLQMATKNKTTAEYNKSNNVVVLDEDFRDMATQVIPEDNIEDMPTQVLENYVPQKSDDTPEQYSEEMISPFKIPNVTPLRNKKRDSLKRPSPVVSNIIIKLSKIPSSSNVAVSPVSAPVVIDDDENYYDATQEILDDLCSQQASPEIVKITKTTDNSNKLPYKSQTLQSDTDDKVQENVSCKSDKTQVAPVKKAGSGLSEGEVTPKKVRPLKLMRTELPDSQEIKTSVALAIKADATTESSSESEVEENSEEMTPIVFRKKQRKKKSPTDVKMDLIKKFEATRKPTSVRVLTRVRKPTAKLLESDIRKPKYLTEQEEDVDTDIITENITRWKSKKDKKNKTTCNDDIDISKSKDSTSIKTEVKTRKTSDIIPKNNNDSTKKNDTNKSHNSKPEARPESAVKSLDPKSNKKNECTSIEIDNENETSGIEKGTRRTRSCKRKTTSKSTEEKLSLSAETDTTIKAPTRKGRDKQTRNSKNSEKANNTTINDKKIIKNATSDVNTDSKQKRKFDKETKTTEKDRKKVEQSDKNESKTKTRGRPKKSVKDSDDDTASETSVRRSKRVKKTDTIDQYLVDISTTAPKNNKNINLDVHELSKVYSISLGSEETPCLKRAATSYVDAPSPKRTRSQSRGARATPASRLRTQYVLFTAFNNDEVRKKLEKLGAVIVTDLKSCTVVLTVAIKRTFKLLCAVGLGIPIVGPEWVQACNNTNMIVDPWQYVIKDEANEQRFQFSLRRTLVSKRGFLKGYHVSSTPKVMPSAPEMKLIVECSGGTWRASGPKWICVSCLADKNLWPELEAKGATIVSNEFILSGVLRQVADVETNRLH